MYFHCQTTLVDAFKEMYRGKFEFGGNRSIIFSEDDEIPVRELRRCIAMALTYHLEKKTSAGARAAERKSRTEHKPTNAVRR